MGSSSSKVSSFGLNTAIDKLISKVNVHSTTQVARDNDDLYMINFYGNEIAKLKWNFDDGIHTIDKGEFHKVNSHLYKVYEKILFPRDDLILSDDRVIVCNGNNREYDLEGTLVICYFSITDAIERVVVMKRMSEVNIPMGTTVRLYHFDPSLRCRRSNVIHM